MRIFHLVDDPDPTIALLLRLAAAAGERDARLHLPPTTYTSSGEDLRAEQKWYDAAYQKTLDEINPS